MTRSLTLCLLLSCSLAFAQDLHVGPNSFIYVDGDGFTPGPNVAPLFVTNDINLATNSSYIYLRNEAQLLQDSDVGNSGQGELSVYQEGNVNQWSYNYWCSPVGGVGGININNPFRVNQIDDPLLGTADPIDSNNSGFTGALNGTADPLVISDRWLFSFVASDQYAEWVYLGSAGPLAPGLGFTMKGNGTGLTGNTTYDFRGKPNNGTITNTVALGQFTLIGNPYPSALDALDLIHDPANVSEIDGTLFYWEQYGNIPSHVLQQYVGGYATYTIDFSGVTETFAPAVFFTYDEQDNALPLPPGPPAVGSKVARRFIPIGQGFMVEGLGGPNGIVTVNNSMREFVKEDGTNSIFFRSAEATNDVSSESNSIQYQDNGLSIVPDDYRRFRVNVDFTVGESQYTRQLVLNFHDTATFGHDRGMELKRAQAYDSDAYFELDGDDYGAQAYPFNQDLRIPLIIDIEEQQPLRFRIFDIQNFEDSQGIYVYDALNETYINLREIDYELNIEPGHYPNRFEIVFTTDNALSAEEVALERLSIKQNNRVHEVQVFNPNGLDISTIELFDVSGRSVIRTAAGSVKTQYKISTQDLSDGVYIATVSTSSDAVKSEKVIVKN
ncbi:T9SS type A sorting domain-containing protein [uncultured Winogradskyella sp.]|uniref:T9SS type A sorting domain-containing protein n=1 Tax=uncultured Winogradskyella sp. TaxID=395353 RepID=UPI0035114A93